MKGGPGVVGVDEAIDLVDEVGRHHLDHERIVHAGVIGELLHARAIDAAQDGDRVGSVAICPDGLTIW